MTDTTRAQLAPLIDRYGLNAAAARAGISKGALSNWLSGKRGMSPAQIDRLAEQFGLSVEVRCVKIRA